MKVIEIQAELRKLGLPYKAKKSILENRLAKARAAAGKKSPAKKARGKSPAKKSPAKKSPAKKAAAKKSPAKKSPAKKSPAKAKKASPAKKAKSPAKKSPAKKTPARGKSPARAKSPARKTPVKAVKEAAAAVAKKVPAAAKSAVKAVKSKAGGGGASVNWLPVLVATVLNVALGAVWYHEKLGYGTEWMKLVGKTSAQIAKTAPSEMARLMGVSILSALVANIVLQRLLRRVDASASVSRALKYSLTLWFAFLALPTLSNGAWNGTAFALTFIQLGQAFVQAVISAVVLTSL